MNDRKKFGLIDWAGIGLFAFGALGTVLMFLTMSSSRIEQHGPMVVVADTWKGIFGVFPSLFLNAAFLFLGARLFLKREAATLFKNAAGCALLTVALSVFFGALSTGAGGKIGAYTGEIVTTRAHIALGALVGLVAIFAAAWFAWLRHTTMGRGYSAPIPAPVTVEAKPAKVVARPIAPPMPTRLSTPQTAAAEEGVTAAESAALFPMEEVAHVSDPVARAEASEAAPMLARSPYPEDVRRMGQVPPGAKPLEVPGALQETPPSAYRWTAPRTEPDEAAQETVHEPVASGFSVQGLRPLRRVEDDIEAENKPVEGFAHDAVEVEAAEIDVAPTGAVEVEAAAHVPTPSWEQPALFRPEAGDEEPVDAYGTPLTLVEKLREARRIGGLERDDARVVDELAHEEHEPIPEPVASITSEELDVLMEDDAVKAPSGRERADTEEDFDYYEDGEVETEPVRARRIPREIDAEIEPVVALHDLAEDDAEDVDEEEDADDALEGEESLDEPIVVAAEIGSFDEETLAEGDELEDEDDFEEEDDADEDEVDALESDEDEVVEETVLAEEEVEEDLELAAPVIRAAAQPVLEPLVLPTVKVTPARTEAIQSGPVQAVPVQAAPVQTVPIQTGLFDAPIAASAAVPTPAPARAEPAAPTPTPATLQPAARKEPAPQAKPAAEPKSAPQPKPAAEAKPAPQPKPARASAPTEKEVILQPVAAAPTERSVKSTSPDATSPETTRQSLLSDIGCLFIERGRVAVSMLQRQHGMDFDAACKVLDDLQEMGLIGPYLGGQRRDILLTREQWLERVSQAGAAR